MRPRCEGKSIARTYLVAQIAAKNLVNNPDKIFTIIYKEKDNIDVLKSLVELYLNTQQWCTVEEAKAITDKNLKFQLDDSNATRYNSSIKSRTQFFIDDLFIKETK